MATKDQIWRVTKIAAIGAAAGLVVLSVFAFLSGAGVAYCYFDRDVTNIAMQASTHADQKEQVAAVTAYDTWQGLLNQSAELQAAGAILDYGLTAMVLGAAFALVCYFVYRESKEATRSLE